MNYLIYYYIIIDYFLINWLITYYLNIIISWLVTYTLSCIIYKTKKEDKRYEINFLVAV
jgi:hypothetical protein